MLGLQKYCVNNSSKPYSSSKNRDQRRIIQALLYRGVRAIKIFCGQSRGYYND